MKPSNIYLKIEQNTVKEFGTEIQTFSILSDLALVEMSFEIVGNKVKIVNKK